MNFQQGPNSTRGAAHLPHEVPLLFPGCCFVLLSWMSGLQTLEVTFTDIWWSLKWNPNTNPCPSTFLAFQTYRTELIGIAIRWLNITAIHSCLSGCTGLPPELIADVLPGNNKENIRYSWPICLQTEANAGEYDVPKCEEVIPSLIKYLVSCLISKGNLCIPKRMNFRKISE